MGKNTVVPIEKNEIKDIYKCIWQCMKIMLTVIIVCGGVFLLIPQNTLFDSLLVVVLSVLVVVVIALLYMDKAKRVNLKNMVLLEIKKS